ncbi:hypothetical protein Ajs_1490 [Acidovorax sp. JS42]|nr:hypothetical protein Ajs_1490 [Acidovorax sp. JS42]
MKRPRSAKHGDSCTRLTEKERLCLNKLLQLHTVKRLLDGIALLAFIFDGGRFHSRLMLAPFSRLPVPPHDESDWGHVAEKMTN